MPKSKILRQHRIYNYFFLYQKYLTNLDLYYMPGITFSKTEDSYGERAFVNIQKNDRPARMVFQCLYLESGGSCLEIEMFSSILDCIVLHLPRNRWFSHYCTTWRNIYRLFKWISGKLNSKQSPLSHVFGNNIFETSSVSAIRYTGCYAAGLLWNS